MCESGDIFHDKVDKILSDIEGVKMHTNDILIISKEIFPKHIDYIRGIFARLIVAGLNLNAHK